MQKLIVYLLSTHFNIHESEIDLPNMDHDPDEYGILKTGVEVLHIDKAILSEESCVGYKELMKYVHEDRIGIYRRLGRSEYFFRFM